MKTKLIFLMMILFMYGCKKNPFDYRTKYLGDYIFVEYNSSWNPIDGYRDTSYTREGEILYGSDENSISINFENETRFPLK